MCARVRPPVCLRESQPGPRLNSCYFPSLEVSFKRARHKVTASLRRQGHAQHHAAKAFEVGKDFA